MSTGVISNYLENELLDHILRQQAYTSPGTSVYVGLFVTADPTDAGGTECSGTSYARQQVTAWDAPTGNGVTANTNVINFPQAGSNWGQIYGIGIWDALTTGNLLFWGVLSTYKTVNSGDTFSIAAGDIDISLGGAFSNYLGQAVINHVLRNTAYSVPTDVYVALYTAAPTAADTGTEVSTSGTAYARQLVEGTTAWDLASGGATQNTNAITYTTATASWGTVAAVGIRDALAAGNLLFHGNLSASKAVGSGDTFRFIAGALDITMD